jgi:hypothetical protein
MRATPLPLFWIVSATLSASAGAQCIDRPLPTSASTRGLAMGDANAAGRDDDVIFYGPAQLAVARGTSVAGERYFDRLASGTVSTTSRLASGGIGVGAQIVEGRNLDGCLTSSLPSGILPARTIMRSQAVVGAALTFKRYRFGLAGKYAGEQADDNRVSQFLVDAGISRDFTLGDFVPLTVAAAMQSIGPDPTTATELGVPRRASLGVASGGPLGPIDLAVAAQAGFERTGTLRSLRNTPMARGGIEVGYTWLDGYSFSLRAGERTNNATTILRHTTFGAGLVLDRLAFDYATEHLAGSRFAHRFGIRLR